MTGVGRVGAGTWSGLLIVLVGITEPGPCGGDIPPNDDLCKEANGECLYTYRGGCDDPGAFTRGLCAGPDYRQCCIKPDETANIEPIQPWRMCYDCHYAVSDGRTKGVECNDPFNEEDPRNYRNAINCTGHCTKQVLNLDANSKSIRRLCTQNCQPQDEIKDVTIHCCYGEKCNGVTRMERDITVMTSLTVLLQLYLYGLL